MSNVAQRIAEWDERAVYFTLKNERGVPIDWIDPVVGFTEYDDYWAVENVTDVFLIKRRPGYTYTLNTVLEE